MFTANDSMCKHAAAAAPCWRGITNLVMHERAESAILAPGREVLLHAGLVQQGCQPANCRGASCPACEQLFDQLPESGLRLRIRERPAFDGQVQRTRKPWQRSSDESLFYEEAVPQ